jgi:hypothetical protein
MKSKVGSTLAVFLIALAFALAAVPASADVLYDNTGPGSFTTNAWSFYNSGGGGTSVTNSFTLSHDVLVNGFTFYVWVDPGNSLSSVTWSITDTPFGAAIATGNATGGPNTQVATAYNYYSILQESISIPSLYLAGANTYWFELSNGIDAYDIGVYWDESDGSSTAFLSSGDQIPSETFQVNGTEVPEPSSFLLLGNGLLALAGLARRKLRG